MLRTERKHSCCAVRGGGGGVKIPAHRTNGLPWRVINHAVNSPQHQHLCSTSGQVMPNRARSSHTTQMPGAVFFIPSLTLSLALHWHSPQHHKKSGWGAKAAPSYLLFSIACFQLNWLPSFIPSERARDVPLQLCWAFARPPGYTLPAVLWDLASPASHAAYRPVLPPACLKGSRTSANLVKTRQNCTVTEGSSFPPATPPTLDALEHPQSTSETLYQYAMESQIFACCEVVSPFWRFC